VPRCLVPNTVLWPVALSSEITESRKWEYATTSWTSGTATISFNGERYWWLWKYAFDSLKSRQ
ncbi:MAG: hypothetical protein ACREOZ_00090, partial [Gloeomargaritales cyanobacterium]